MIDDSIATLTAQPRRLKLGSKEYDVKPLDWDDFGALQAWCDRQWPDPITEVSKHLDTEEFTVEQERYLMRLAIEQASRRKPQLGSPECDELLKSPKGLVQQLYLSIRKTDRTFTEAMAEQIVREAAQAEIAQVYRATNTDMLMSGHDPKANGSGATNA